MRLRCIACEVFARPLYTLAARSRNTVDIELIEKARHNWPHELRKMIQERIAGVDAEKYDAIVLAYGLCGKALDGITAMKTNLVLPKAHDCITVFLGSRDRYREKFQEEPGTFWYIRDYVERSSEDELDGFGGPGLYEDADRLFREYVEKYGEDNALFLMKEMSAWQSHYKRAVFIDTGIGPPDGTSSLARQKALSQGWNYQELKADFVLLKRLLEGDWQEDFLVLNPGQKVKMAVTDEVIQISD